MSHYSMGATTCDVGAKDGQPQTLQDCHRVLARRAVRMRKRLRRGSRGAFAVGNIEHLEAKLGSLVQRFDRARHRILFVNSGEPSLSARLIGGDFTCYQCLAAALQARQLSSKSTPLAG